MRATVIVPTMSGSRVEPLLQSLARGGGGQAQVLVVDNSGDPRIEAVAAELADAEVLRPGSNLGYSRAVNLAAARAEGEALVLLNDDSVVDEGFVERVVSPLDPGSGVVMAAGVMRDAAEPGLIDSAGMELDRTLLVFDYLNGEPVSALETGVIRDPIGPSGAAAAFWREAFTIAGGFDEGLFAYWEDVDLVLRLRREGAQCRLAADARGSHRHSATLGSGSASKNYLVGFGRGYVLRKWGVLTPRRLPGVVAREAAICAGQALVDRNLSGVRGRVRGVRSPVGAQAYPGAEVIGRAPGLAATLRRRWRRRRRLRARGQ